MKLRSPWKAQAVQEMSIKKAIQICVTWRKKHLITVAQQEPDKPDQDFFAGPFIVHSLEIQELVVWYTRTPSSLSLYSASKLLQCTWHYSKYLHFPKELSLWFCMSSLLMIHYNVLTREYPSANALNINLSLFFCLRPPCSPSHLSVRSSPHNQHS